MTQRVKRFLASAAVVLMAVILLLPLSCKKHEEKKNFTIGIINPNTGTHAICLSLMKELQNIFTAENKEVKFVERPCSTDGIDAALNVLMEKNPDMLFSVTTPATKKAIARAQGAEIPVIFAMHDPIGSGIIKSLPSPGGNFTGIQIRGSTEKGLEWLLTIAPDVKNIFVPVKFDTKAATQCLADLQATIDAMGARLTVAEVNSQEELEQSLASIPEDVDAIFILHSILISANAQKIADEAIKRKLPTGASSNLADKGILLSFGIDYNRIGKQAARLAHLVLSGESAQDVPAEIAEFSLALNLQTAAQIGLAIPDNIIAQSDEVIR